MSWNGRGQLVAGCRRAPCGSRAYWYSLFHATFNTLEHSAVKCSKELSASAAHPCGTHASRPCSCTVDPTQLTGWVGAVNRESANDLLPHRFHVSLCAVSHCSDSSSKIRCWKLHDESCMKLYAACSTRHGASLVRGSRVVDASHRLASCSC